MFNWDYNLFIGDDTADIQVGFTTGDDIFVIGEISSSDEGETLKDTLDHIKTTVETQKADDLDGFVTILESEIKKIEDNLVALAATYVVDSVIYIITRGSGEVYVARDGNMQKLLGGDNTASGYVNENDYFLLSNKTFSDATDEAFLQKLMFNTRPQEVIETITPELKGTDNVGMIAMFMQAQKQEEIEATEVVQELSDEADVTVGVNQGQESTESVQTEQSQTMSNEEQSQSMPSPKIQAFFNKLKTGSSKGKKATFALVVILLAVLTWSVISGNSRREKAEFAEKVAKQQQTIATKLAEADELVGVNTQKSLRLIDESREIVTNLKQEATAKEYNGLDTLDELSKEIASVEQGILKKEEGRYEEFYDLNLIEKGAQATSMYINEGSLAMLDAKNGKVYVLDIAEKAVDTYSAKEIKKATKVALHRDEPFVFGSKIGVVKLPEKTKVETVISADSDWGSVKDFWMYNGNLYLLDAGSDEIYKYLVAEEGYSEKRSYFGAGQAIDLKRAQAMAIDASIYVAAGAKTFKYTSGVSQVFSVSIPDETDITFDDVYADRSSEDVYYMDKGSQRIFVTNREGELKKQISASILENAHDFIVAPDIGILILEQDRLYMIKEK